MKHFFLAAAVVATAALASCGNEAAEAQRKADSTRGADSLHNLWIADSTKTMQEEAQKAEMQKHREDSMKTADSLAKLTPEKKK